MANGSDGGRQAWPVNYQRTYLLFGIWHQSQKKKTITSCQLARIPCLRAERVAVGFDASEAVFHLTLP